MRKHEKILWHPNYDVGYGCEMSTKLAFVFAINCPSKLSGKEMSLVWARCFWWYCGGNGFKGGAS